MVNQSSERASDFSARKYRDAESVVRRRRGSKNSQALCFSAEPKSPRAFVRFRSFFHGIPSSRSAARAGKITAWRSCSKSDEPSHANSVSLELDNDRAKYAR